MPDAKPRSLQALHLEAFQKPTPDAKRLKPQSPSLQAFKPSAATREPRIYSKAPSFRSPQSSILKRLKRHHHHQLSLHFMSDIETNTFDYY